MRCVDSCLLFRVIMSPDLRQQAHAFPPPGISARIVPCHEVSPSLSSEMSSAIPSIKLSVLTFTKALNETHRATKVESPRL